MPTQDCEVLLVHRLHVICPRLRHNSRYSYQRHYANSVGLTHQVGNFVVRPWGTVGCRGLRWRCQLLAGTTHSCYWLRSYPKILSQSRRIATGRAAYGCCPGYEELPRLNSTISTTLNHREVLLT